MNSIRAFFETHGTRRGKFLKIGERSARRIAYGSGAPATRNPWLRRRNPACRTRNRRIASRTHCSSTSRRAGAGWCEREFPPSIPGHCRLDRTSRKSSGWSGRRRRRWPCDRFRNSIDGVAVARRGFGEGHVIAARWKIPVIARGPPRRPVDGRRPCTTRHRWAARSGRRDSRDGIGEDRFGGQRVGAIFRGGAILQPAGLPVMQPIAKTKRVVEIDPDHRPVGHARFHV